MNRTDLINKINSNINAFGYHITIVSGGQEPRYAYSIGLTAKFDFELIFAGALYYFEKDIYTIFRSIINELSNVDNTLQKSIKVSGLGSFKLLEVHPSWSEKTMLGVFDYYNLDNIKAYQIIPSKDFYTLDIPKMSSIYDKKLEPVWKWLEDDWEYKISDKITIVTNLDALKGEPITQVMRWEEDEWEMFAGSNEDLSEKDIRIVPIGNLLASDKSLQQALDLEIGKGLWRENEGDEWNDWG